MSVKRTVIGLGMAMAVFTASARGGTPKIFVSVNDTSLYPGDQEGRWLTVTMSNPTVKIGGYQVALIIENPQAINFTYFDVDTTLPFTRCFQKCVPPPCRETCFVDCPDTCYDFKSQIISNGTVSQGADLIEGHRLAETYEQVTCIYQTAGSSGPVIQPGSNRVLFRIPLDIFPIADTVSLSERQVQITIDPTFTFFSDSTGNITYRVSDTVNTLALTNGTVFIPFSSKGDVNFDGLLTSSDVVRLLNYTFLGLTPPLPSVSVGDVNCDGFIDSSDVVREMNRIFLGVPFPCI
jgi:hypothetical protein